MCPTSLVLINIYNSCYLATGKQTPASYSTRAGEPTDSDSPRLDFQSLDKAVEFNVLALVTRKLYVSANNRYPQLCAKATFDPVSHQNNNYAGLWPNERQLSAELSLTSLQLGITAMKIIDTNFNPKGRALSMYMYSTNSKQQPVLRIQWDHPVQLFMSNLASNSFLPK